jgi:DNA-binding beta-propeller fold protein YncE
MIVRLLASLLLIPTALVAQTGTLVVVNQKQHAVDLVDPSTRTVLAAVNVGVNGHEIALDKDGRLAYVPIYSNTGVGKPGTNGQMIDVIDLARAKVVKEIDLGHPVRPHKPVFGPGGFLYVTAELDQAIDVVDVDKGVVVQQIPTGQPQSHILGLSADGRRGYTANVGEGSVSVLDMKEHKLIKMIPLTKRVQRIAVSNDGQWVFTSDSDQPRVAAISTRTNALGQWITVEGIPYVTQPTPDGRYLLVAAAKDEKGVLNVVDLRTMKEVRTIATAAPVVSFLVHEGRVYMSCGANGAVEVLDVRAAEPEKWALETPIQLAPGVDGMAWTMVKLDAAK